MKATRHPATPDELREMLRYDPNTGELFWKITTRNGKGVAGNRAGSFDKSGYRKVNVKYRNYLEHRVSWAIHHGMWPSGLLDHINGDGTDNRIANLRPATGTQNRWNSAANRNNTTGFKGVTRNGDRFMAQLQTGGRNKNLGRYKTAEEASTAYQRACKEHHGEFAWSGLADRSDRRS